MSAFEGSHKSLLQGVSQQVPRERLEGQVGAQLNMLSDAVTGPRRRPGAQLVRTIAAPGATPGTIIGWDTDIGGQVVKLLLNITTGTITMLDTAYATIQTLTSPYLIAASRKSIRVTTVGERMVIANLANKPTLGPAAAIPDNTKAGFFYIKAGAFAKTYTVTAKINGVDYTATYTTPSGAGAGDAALSTAEYIASQLVTKFTTAPVSAPATCTVVGAFVYIASTASHTLTLSTDSYSAYIVTSAAAYLQSASELPARLPAAAHGYTIGTTSVRSPVYYRYDNTKTQWLESGSVDAPASLLNMPVIIRRNLADTAWEFDPTPYEGRFAGDAVSNPTPPFITRGITGIGSFQSRLVLLSGPTASLSGSNKPERWFRSTLTELIDSDPIQVGASANSSAAYQYAVPFQKDLLLFADKYQALIPSGNTALTPRNATVVITSNFESDLGAQPISLGRTLMYALPRSTDFYGILEMLPSQYTDSQYISQDVTAHLPKYMPGRCTWSVSSSVSSLALFGSDGDTYSCTVHEYLWGDQGKAQQAWHKWSFPYPISDAFFSGALVTLVFVQNGMIALCTVDPRAGALTSEAETRPYLDMYYPLTVAASQVTLNADLLTFDPNIAGRTLLSQSTGDLAGEWIGTKPVGPGASVLTTVGTGFPAGDVYAGIPFTSTLSPSPPTVKDSNGVVISSNKLTLLRYMVGTVKSGAFNALVRDAGVDAEFSSEVSTLFWPSAELALGEARLSGETVTIVPVRADASRTTFAMTTSGLQEMNIISLEYVCKYKQKLRRR